ncbi:MAG: DNA recombination protein RmuC [Bacteroidia bacterium]
MTYLIIAIVILLLALTYLLIKNSQLNNQLSASNEKISLLEKNINENIFRIETLTKENAVLTNQNTAYATKLEHVEKSIETKEQELQHYIEKTENLIKENTTLSHQNATYNNQIQNLEKIIESQKQELQNLQNKINELTKENTTLSSQNAAYKNTIEHLEKLLESQRQELQNLQNKLKTEFENISSKILEQNTQKLAEQNQQILSNVISPFKENISQIKELERKIQTYYDNENKERASLKTNIENLLNQSNEVKQTAEKLANALTTQVKYQGNWGEMILERILEMSGLQENREYKTQSKENDKQPDVIILLPNNKYLVIDSKVTLHALVNYYSAQNDEERTVYAQQIISSVKNHYENLSKKNYETIYKADGKVLDFVLMFIPVENVLNIVYQYNPDLFNDAVKKRVLIVTPTSLLATLKTIYFVWQQEKQRKEFEEILQSIQRLYEKMKTFTEYFSDIEEKLKKVLESFENAKNNLISGKGNVMSIFKNKIEPYINPKAPITKLLPTDTDEE